MMSERRRSVSPLFSHRPLEERTPLSHDNISLEDFATSTTTPLKTSQTYSGIQQKDGSSDDGRIDEEYRPSLHSIPNITIKNRLLRFDWWWEVGALVVATINIIAIITVLVHANGKPILDWHVPIQPASLVAIFSTIAKSSLLVPLAACLSQLKWSYFEKPQTLSHMQDFEDASRGPWGAMMLLWKVKGTALLASVGALVTLLMLAFEPSAQQVIRLGSRKSIVNSNSRTIATAAYKPGAIATTMSLSDWRFYGGAEDSAEVRFSMALNMMAAMAGRPSIYQSNAYCPTTECSFYNFTTLGACTTCESESILVNNGFGCAYYDRESVSGVSARNDTVFTELQSFQAAVREASKRDSIVGYGMNCSRTHEGYPTFGLSFDVNVAENTTNLQGLGQRQNQTSEYLWSDAVFGETNKTFLGIITDGTFNDTFKQSTYRFCTSGYGREGIINNDDFDTIDTFTCLMTSDSLSSLEDLDKFGEFNGTLTHCRMSVCAHEYKNVSIQNGQTKIGSITKRPLLRSGYNENFNDTVATAEGSDFSANIGPKNLAQLASTIELVAYSSSFQEFTKYLVDQADWPLAFERIATAVSDYIRSADNPDARLEYGLAHSSETFIQIRWAWLTLPLLMLLLSIAILVCTIVESSQKLFILKHSILAPILPRLENGHTVKLQTASSGRQTENDLLKLAKGINATLVKNKDGKLELKRNYIS
ncbi:hypothetical protein BKA66DRAFT_553649 [Pyrenochaeta sp. MPI-SDFR-AT-0127]|nr:hypothetical protein BKA66DRAFT_553649 [Pyrenochaeta sp. MPI-SDFR-AT-0127]